MLGLTFSLLLSVILSLLPTLTHQTATRGDEIRDLSPATLDSDAAGWTISNSLGGATSPYTSSCGSGDMIGGYGQLDQTGSIERTFTGLPAHDIVYVTVTVYVLDDWLPSDSVDMFIDSVQKPFLSSPGDTSTWSGGTCGNGGLNDLGAITVQAKAFHTGGSMTIKFQGNQRFDSLTQSWGIGSISMSYGMNDGSEVEEACGYSASETLSSDNCSCPPGQWDNSGCTPCDSSCNTCFGGTNADCYECDEVYQYDGDACIPACANYNYLYNFTCLTDCDPPFTVGTQNGQPTCDFPCNIGEYYYWDGSCDTTCDYPLNQRDEGGYLYCDNPCLAGEFIYWDQSCSLTCPSPLTQNPIADEFLCEYPCTGTQFLYWEGSCLANCDPPLSSYQIQGEDLCDFPCTSGQYLYWNNDCEASCPSPLTTTPVTDENLCEHPCTGSDYLYWDGSCQTNCDPPLSSSVTKTKNMCAFPCTSGQYLYWNNDCETECPNLLTTTPVQGENLCEYPCTSGEYLYEDGTCDPVSCNAPNSIIPHKGENLCFYTGCLAGEHLFWDGSCNATCNSPLVAETVAGVLMCSYICDSSEYLYWEGSCYASCNHPLDTTVFLTKNFCEFNCPTGQYLYWDQFCDTSCPSPLTTTPVADENLCEYPCTGTDYLYWEGTCLPTCATPLSPYQIRSEDLCAFPCTSGQYLYWNNDCEVSCPSPLTTTAVQDENLCEYTCTGGDHLYWNGDCEPTCPDPYTPNTIKTKNLCEFGCVTGTDFLYWDSSCSSTCAHPLDQTTYKGKNICEFNCPDGDYLYWDQSCETLCPTPLTTTPVANESLCEYPCTAAQHLYWDGSCQTSCNYPLDASVTKTKNLCDFPCTSGQFLYWNQDCEASCPSPLTTTPVLLENLCEFTCTGSDYLYWEGTCLPTCDYPLNSYVTKTKNLCDFPCTSGQYLYWDQHCDASCPSPLTITAVTDENLCEYTCTGSDFLYWEGSCLSSCDPPLSAYQIQSEDLCAFPCTSGEFLYWNNDCETSCPSPLTTTPVTDENLCEYPCTNSEYLYWEGSCNSTCDYPLDTSTLKSKQFCEFDCTSGEYIYWDKFCGNDCDFPLIEQPVYDEVVCDHPCDPSEFLYWDQLCYDTCESPLYYTQIRDRQICDTPCTSDEYLFWDESCEESCNSPLTVDVIIGKNFCNYTCNSTEFLYWDKSCDTECWEPLIQQTYKDKQFCEFPCASGQFLTWYETCSLICPSPLTVVPVAGENFCNYTCEAEEYLYWDKSCELDCSFPMIEAVGSANEKYCKYPCDNLDDYYYPTEQYCKSFCNEPYQEVQVNEKLIGCDIVLTDDEKSSVDNAGTANNATFSIALAKMLQYIKYMNIQYPAKVIYLLRNQADSPISLNFGPKIPESVKAKFESHELPENFAKYQLHSSYLVNFWRTLTSLGIILSIGFFFGLVSYIARLLKMRNTALVFQKLNVVVNFNLTLLIFCTNYDSLMLFSSLQFRVIEFKEAYNTVSFFVAFIFLCMGIGLLAFTARLIKQIRDLRHKVGRVHAKNGEVMIRHFIHKWERFQVLYMGFKEKSVYTHAFLFIFVSRMVVFQLVITYLISFPLVQAIIITIFSVCMFIYLLIMRPFKNPINLFQMATFEIMILVFNGMVLALAIMDKMEYYDWDLRDRIGEVIVGINFAVSGAAIFFIVLKMTLATIRAIKLSRRKQNPNHNGWLQLILIPFQQGGMGFEQIAIVEDDKNQLALNLERSKVHPLDTQHRNTTVIGSKKDDKKNPNILINDRYNGDLQKQLENGGEYGDLISPNASMATLVSHRTDGGLLFSQRQLQMASPTGRDSPFSEQVRTLKIGGRKSQPDTQRSKMQMQLLGSPDKQQVEGQYYRDFKKYLEPGADGTRAEMNASVGANSKKDSLVDELFAEASPLKQFGNKKSAPNNRKESGDRLISNFVFAGDLVSNRGGSDPYSDPKQTSGSHSISDNNNPNQKANESDSDLYSSEDHSPTRFGKNLQFGHLNGIKNIEFSDVQSSSPQPSERQQDNENSDVDDLPPRQTLNKLYRKKPSKFALRSMHDEMAKNILNKQTFTEGLVNVGNRAKLSVKSTPNLELISPQGSQLDLMSSSPMNSHFAGEQPSLSINQEMSGGFPNQSQSELSMSRNDQSITKKLVNKSKNMKGSMAMRPSTLKLDEYLWNGDLDMDEEDDE